MIFPRVSHNDTSRKHNEVAVRVKAVKVKGAVAPPCDGAGRGKRLGYVAGSKCAHCDLIWCV
jgi:hypothetical protein